MAALRGSPRPLQWLIVGSFSGRGVGTVYSLAGERLVDNMRRVGPRVEIPGDASLGEAAPRRVVLSFERLRDFRVSHILGSVRVLKDLVDLADAVDRPRDPIDPRRAIESLRSIVGSGELLARAEATVEETARADRGARKSEADPAGASRAVDEARPRTGDVVDAIFSKAEVAPETPNASARTGIDRFVAAIRNQDSRTPSPAEVAPAIGPSLASVIRDAARRAALRLASTPEFRSLEGAWRGVAMVVSQVRDARDVGIELLDADAPDTLTSLHNPLTRPPAERPDAVFVLAWAGENLSRLAELAATSMVPVVVPVGPSIAFAEGGSLPSWWGDLRGSDASRWLCLVGNGVVVNDEMIAAHRRSVAAPPALAPAAMLTAALSRHGTLQGTVGRSGALVAPVADETNASKRRVPTEREVTLQDQRRAADCGIVLLGNEPGTDRVLCSSMTTAFAGEDAQSLPAQILVGRAVRMARDVVEGLGRDPSPSQLDEAFARLGGLFLPRGPSGGANFRASRSEGGKRLVDVSFSAALTGTPMAFAFEL